MHIPQIILALVFALALFPVTSSCESSPAFVGSSGAFQATSRSHHSIIQTTGNILGRLESRGRYPFVVRGQKGDEWDEEHLAHGAAEIHVETDDEVIEAEDEAAFDAHDLSDPGMEAAALERSLMMAEEMAENKQKEASEGVDAQDADEGRTWNDEHLAHGASNIHIETEDEVEEAEDEVAFDAHDLSDPGMEAAALERSLMMAEEWAEKAKEEATKSPENGVDESQKWNEEHLAHGAAEIHIETDEEVEEAEEEVAFDAYDTEDPGVEAAALERSLMMAEEWAAKKKEEAEGKQKE